MKNIWKYYVIAVLMIFISVSQSKAQQSSPSVTNKNARKGLKEERKRENGRRKRVADNKDLATPKIANDRRLPKRKKKKTPKSEREQNSTATSGGDERKSQYPNEPTR